jgi:hypothetical protein
VSQNHQSWAQACAAAVLVAVIALNGAGLFRDESTNMFTCFAGDRTTHRPDCSRRSGPPEDIPASAVQRVELDATQVQRQVPAFAAMGHYVALGEIFPQAVFYLYAPEPFLWNASPLQLLAVTGAADVRMLAAESVKPLVEEDVLTQLHADRSFDWPRPGPGEPMVRVRAMSEPAAAVVMVQLGADLWAVDAELLAADVRGTVLSRSGRW